MSRFQYIKPTSRKGGLLSGYTGDPSGIWSLRQRYELLTFPLLDYHPGATAAYSLRSLSSSYTGPVVTVRRSSDDAEADFTASEVAGGALATWVGANDGFVTTWYDQSGNGNNAVQATSGAQPKIVSSGNLVEENGRPAMQFDGTDDYLANTDIDWSRNVSEPLSVFVASNQTTSGATVACRKISGTFSGWHLRLDGSTGYARVLNFDGTNGDAAIGDTDFRSTHATYSAFLASAASLYVNGAAQTASLLDSLTSYTASTDDLTIGAVGAIGELIEYSAAKMQEVVIYFSDVSSQRTDIEAEMSQAYGI